MDNIERESYRIKKSPGFLEGQNSAVDASVIKESEAALLSNVRWKRGKWIRDTGGPAVVNASDVVVEFSGFPQAIIEHRLQTGIIETILITTNTAYRLVGENWNQLLNGAGAALVLSGEIDKRVTWASAPWDDRLVFTNQIDVVQYYSPTDNRVRTLNSLAASLPANIKAAAVCVFDASIFLLGTEENGSDFPQRARWHAKGDTTAWTTLDAGFQDFLEIPDPIVTGKKLGPYLAIYRTRTITRGEVVTADDRRFHFEDAVVNAPVLSAQAVVDVQDVHYVFGANDFFIYRGGVDVDNSFAVKVKDEIFEEIDPDFYGACYSYYDKTLKEVWFLYPFTTIELDDGISAVQEFNTYRMYRYHLLSTAWSRRLFEQKHIHAIGSTASVTGANLTWDAAEGTWAQQVISWNDVVLLEGSPTVYLGYIDVPDTNSTKLERYDYFSPTDAGTDILPEIHSKVFEDELGFELTFDSLDYQFQGGDHHVSIVGLNSEILGFSVDTSLATYSFPINRVDGQVTDKVLQIHWIGEGEGFVLGRFAFRYSIETEF